MSSFYLIKGKELMIELKNSSVCALVSETGAELRRLTVDGVDQLWCGDEKIWNGVSPVLFPVCSGLPGDMYTLGGKEYRMPKHGFARQLDFEVVKQGSRFVTLRLTDTEETRKYYPWHFVFTVTYSLHGKRLDVTYTVENKSETTMYFSEGSHESYACPEGIEEYDVIFEKEETVGAKIIEGVRLTGEERPLLHKSRVLPLYEKYFTEDALIFTDLKSRAATLRHRTSGRSVTVEFPGCDYFLIWTVPGAKYVCLEPWCGICGTKGDGIAIEDKEGIITLQPHTVYERTHTIHY